MGVLGEKGLRIRELTALVQKRFNFSKDSVELYAEKVANRGLSATAQCESLRGKLRAQRAKAMKFVDGFMIHSGQPARDYVDSAARHVMLRQGVIGIKVKIMRAFDPTGKLGPNTPLPDKIVIQEPKDDDKASEPHSVCKIVKAPEAPVAQAPPQQAGPQ